MGVQPIIVEKDLWVCWILRRIFSMPKPVAGLIFKGGTSLSKAYGLIERFSEDIDLSLDRHDLGFTGDADPGSPGLSAKKRKALLEELQAAAEEVVGGALKDDLHATIEEALDGQAFSLTLDERDAQTLLFAYPSGLATSAYGSDYIRPSVRLEFGARSEHVPAETRIIKPYVFDQFPEVLPSAETPINTLSAERTFWEKATILHMLAHRNPEQPLGDRMSRHYYDLARLAESEVRGRALSDLSLLEAVSAHKSIFFRAAWARYEDAKPGTLKLLPPPALEQALKTDFQRMSEMLFGPPPDFANVLTVIANLEEEVNQRA